MTVREQFPREESELIAGHTLTLVPALRLENLLPLELQYRCVSGRAPAPPPARAAPPGDTVPFHQVFVVPGFTFKSFVRLISTLRASTNL